MATKNKMTGKHYLVCLSGQGDTTFKIINKKTWDYIHSPRPKFKAKQYAINELLPPGVIADTEKPATTIRVTSGSYENDRALQVKGIKFYSLMAYCTWIMKNKVKISGEYAGYIY